MGVDEDEWGNDSFSIIDGEGVGNVVEINTNDVNLSHFIIIPSYSIVVTPSINEDCFEIFNGVNKNK